MTICFNQTQYLFGAASARQFPDDSGSEIAFAGRSNAGKSSAINAICQRKNLVRSGKTPGTTRLIHFFQTTPNYRLVDLPGYGYARLSKSEKKRWQMLLENYLTQRRCLRGLVLAMDIRHPLTELDLHLLKWCDIKVLILLTKRDKVNKHCTIQTARQVDAATSQATSVLPFSKTISDDAEAVRQIIADW